MGSFSNISFDIHDNDSLNDVNNWIGGTSKKAPARPKPVDTVQINNSPAPKVITQPKKDPNSTMDCHPKPTHE